MKVNYLKCAFSKDSNKCRCYKFERSYKLVEAVQVGDVERVRRLLRNKKINGYFKIHGGDILLSKSVDVNDVQMVEFLLSLKSKHIRIGPKRLTSCLFTALDNNRVRVAKQLIRAGANVQGGLVLDLLERPGQERFVSYLHYAVHMRDRELVNLLVDHGADVNARDAIGEPVIHQALLLGQLDVVKLLMSRGCNIYSPSEVGLNVLQAAILRGNIEAVIELLNVGADLMAPHHLGLTAMHFAAMSDRNDVNLVQLLLHRGVPPDVPDTDLVTPLHIALESNKSVMAGLLVSRGADVNARNSDDYFPLHMAATHADASMVEMLLVAGANVNDTLSPNDPFTVLHLACEKSDTDMIQTLLDFGADVTLRCCTEDDDVSGTPFSLIEDKCLIGPTRAMIRHFAIRNCEGQPVDPADMQEIRESHSMSDFYEKCLVELARMKLIMVAQTTVSYYQALICHEDRLVALARNEKVVATFAANEPRSMFQIYAQNLENKFKWAEKTMRARGVMENCLMDAFGLHLPFVVIKRIQDFLSFSDLPVQYQAALNELFEKRTCAI